MEDGNIKLVFFKDINLNDVFFDSLREDYDGFNDWFNKKAQNNKRAFVYYDDENKLCDFLYLKIENEALLDIEPKLPPAKRLKVGTFKIDSRGSKRGERFIKKIMDVAMFEKIEQIYVTIFEKQESLIRIFKRYGFYKCGTKGSSDIKESVYIKDLKDEKGDIYLDYPKINRIGNKKYLLSIRPEFHSKMFPDSILNNENPNKLVSDIPYTNSINKVYISNIKDTKSLKRGDIVTIYRTKFNGSAWYTAVASTICVVSKITDVSDYSSFEDFYIDVNNISIFDKNTLKKKYKEGKFVVIKMLYNVAFTKRIIRKDLIEKVNLDSENYWGFFELTDEQFEEIYKLGEVNESYFIN